LLLECSRTFFPDPHPLMVLGFRYVVWLGKGGRKGVVLVYVFTCLTAVEHSHKRLSRRHLSNGLSWKTDSRKDTSYAHVEKDSWKTFLLRYLAWGADTYRRQRGRRVVQGRDRRKSTYQPNVPANGTRLGRWWSAS